MVKLAFARLVLLATIFAYAESVLCKFTAETGATALAGKNQASRHEGGMPWRCRVSTPSKKFFSSPMLSQPV
jgi:hypothetical protein